jgi:hypothetical protein
MTDEAARLAADYGLAGPGERVLIIAGPPLDGAGRMGDPQKVRRARSAERRP